MPRPDFSTAFEHTRLPHSDDGKQVRGIIARCGGHECTAAIPLPVNTMANSGSQSSMVEWKFIARKLEAKGWTIGKRRLSATIVSNCGPQNRSRSYNARPRAHLLKCFQ